MKFKLFSLLLIAILCFVFLPKNTFAHWDYTIPAWQTSTLEKGAVIWGKGFVITPLGDEQPLFKYNSNNWIVMKINATCEFRAYTDTRVYYSLSETEVVNMASRNSKFSRDTRYKTWPLFDQDDGLFDFDLSEIEETFISKGHISTDHGFVEYWDYDSNQYKPITTYSSYASAVIEFKNPVWIKIGRPVKFYKNQNMANVVSRVSKEKGVKPWQIQQVIIYN